MKFQFSLFCLCLLFFSCNAQNKSKPESLAPKVFAEKLQSDTNPQLLDVRTPEEFAGQHLDKAANLNWNSGDFDKQLTAYDKNKPVYVYCLSGGRSAKAAEKLSGMGFTKVYELEGGIMKWNAEFPSENTSGRIIGMCSQEYGDLIKSGKRVLVDFNAPWCAPCQEMKPYMEKLASDPNNRTKIISRNADEDKTLVSEMKITELPALYLYEDGKLIWQHNGYISEEELKKQL